MPKRIPNEIKRQSDTVSIVGNIKLHILHREDIYNNLNFYNHRVLAIRYKKNFFPLVNLEICFK